MSEQRFVLDKLYYTIMTPIEKISVGRCYMTYREVVDTLNEQQSIITKLKELNDDKGKRIISLIRINKTLKEENEQLRGINKEIGDDLHNCRLNKDIVSEKLKLWQDTLAEYDIYTIKDFKELMKNDN